jgi:DNA-binding response OmpR family regulator
METTKILVVDDEKGICDNVLKILAKKNYQVTQALSAKEALEKMAKESYALLISDIVMPETNGLELLRLARDQWPLTKVIIMTAYASTETAMKAIRLGALDYIPKPFTPNELRSTVEKALAGELAEAKVSEKERKSINLIDMDIPFDRTEVAKVTGEDYVDRLGPSDMPIIEIPSPETLDFYCKVGEKVCDIYKKLGNTCKAGLKSNDCPQAKKAAKGQKALRKPKGFDSQELIGVDQPFSYEEVVSVTGPEYVQNLQSDGFAFVPYEDLTQRMSAIYKKKAPHKAVVHEFPKKAAKEDILVIDDEAAVNNNIRKILIKKGYHVEQAMTKEEALRAIDLKTYGLVLLDLKIPGVEGLELLKAIREKSSETLVIIITGYASIETAKESARIGAIDYLRKPFTPDEIRKVTENAISLAA